MLPGHTVPAVQNRRLNTASNVPTDTSKQKQRRPSFVRPLPKGFGETRAFAVYFIYALNDEKRSTILNEWVDRFEEKGQTFQGKRSTVLRKRVNSREKAVLSDESVNSNTADSTVFFKFFS